MIFAPSLVEYIDLALCSDWQLYCCLGDLWSAGMETTTTTMEWALLYMCLHRDEQSKVPSRPCTAVAIVLGGGARRHACKET